LTSDPTLPTLLLNTSMPEVQGAISEELEHSRRKQPA
jgi:hypothetical protein